jgi:hypothetical protein
MSKTLLADEPVAYIPPPNCCFCGRFVNVKTAKRFVEQGDYGTVYSVEFACPDHGGPHE